jgi:hypothetical protein
MKKTVLQDEVIIELDEMWYFLRLKEQGLGLEDVL